MNREFLGLIGLLWILWIVGEYAPTWAVITSIPAFVLMEFGRCPKKSTETEQTKRPIRGYQPTKHRTIPKAPPKRR